MSLIPDPLHPAVVHFPIVLLLLAVPAAFAAVFWRGAQLPRLAALLLVLGAVGAWLAVQSGESGGGLLEKGTPQMETLLDAHETWAKRTFAVAAAAAVAAVLSALAGRWPRLGRAVAILAAIASVGAGYAVYETGHRGGALVYRHAAGVEVAASGAAAVPGSEAVPAAPPRPESHSKEKDAD